MIRGFLVVSLSAMLASAAPAAGELADPAAFEQGFTVSLYQFDACGDALAGRMFRRALAERFAQCPFTPEARALYRQHTDATFARARRTMNKIIEANGGLPRQLEGMPMTCHELQAREDYRAFRALLERYAEGSASAEAVIPSACDAAGIMP
jgi:hypothetical protein